MKKYIVFGVGLLLVGFQNCTDLKVEHGSVPTGGLQNAGNGEGYTGKITRYLARDPENKCADNSFVRSSVERREDKESAKYFLTKLECRAVNPARLITLEREFGGTADSPAKQIVFQSVPFEQNSGLPISRSYRLTCTSASAATKEIPSDAISGGSSVALAPSGESIWVVKDCDLGGNCRVAKNCFTDANNSYAFIGDPDCMSHAPGFPTGRPDFTFAQGRGRPLQGCTVTPR